MSHCIASTGRLRTGAVMESARAIGSAALLVQTEDAQGLYERFGFRAVGSVRSPAVVATVAAPKATLR